MKIKCYDKYQKVNVIIYPTDDDLSYSTEYFKSAGSLNKCSLWFESPDVEDYEPSRWSDLENFTIQSFNIIEL